MKVYKWRGVWYIRDEYRFKAFPTWDAMMEWIYFDDAVIDEMIYLGMY